jgi:hypothetical protein
MIILCASSLAIYAFNPEASEALRFWWDRSDLFILPPLLYLLTAWLYSVLKRRIPKLTFHPAPDRTSNSALRPPHSLQPLPQKLQPEGVRVTTNN